jgi:type IV secretion system protein VirB6
VIVTPGATTCTLFKGTAPIFDRWVNLALGFALYPMLTSGMAAIARDLTPTLLTTVETNDHAAGHIGRSAVRLASHIGLARPDGRGCIVKK